MTLVEFNLLDKESAREKLYQCCGSTSWTNSMLKEFPFSSINELKNKSIQIWNKCDEGDFLEAFSNHPKIGERPDTKHESTAKWAEGEQSSVQIAKQKIKDALEEANKIYENKFGYIFIVCATGKSAEEMLLILNDRLKNDASTEIKIAAGEQIKITLLRIDKLLK